MTTSSGRECSLERDREHEREHDQDVERDREVSRYDAIGVLHPELNELVQLAAEICEVPATAINLMTQGTQVSVASIGMPAEMCAREDSMCNAILYTGGPVHVSDASKDSRWFENPFVNGEVESFRFYYARQLVSPRGIVVGTLCVFDHRPRHLDQLQLSQLDRLAKWAVDLLELRLRSKELEATVADLTAVRAELERSNETLGLFSAQVAHDLRGPVSALTASLGMLREDPEGLDADQAWLVERAVGSAHRMDALIGDMLAFAALDGRARQEDVDLAEVLSQVRLDLSADLVGVRLSAESLPVITGDPTQCRVVLQNLVANAVKFTRQVPAPTVRVSAALDPRGWWIEVADNGPGLAPADRERVFGLFEQADASNDGIGLGLATCMRIVSGYGGRIRLGDAPEGGALLRIEIPADDAARVLRQTSRVTT